MSARLVVSTGAGVIRFTRGLRAFLREGVSLDQAKALVRDRMRTRTEAFVRVLERGIFANPRSPYLKLFRAAGCGLADARSLVEQQGVEGALEQLHRAGVYVTLGEFKGRMAAVRGGETFRFRDWEFDNPLVTAHYRTTSGGSHGRPTRILIDLEHLTQSAPHWALWLAAHGALARPVVFFTPYYPGIINRQLICAKIGSPFARWFSTGGGGSLMYRLVSGCLHGLVRRAAGFPKPEPTPLEAAWRVGECVAGMIRNGVPPCVVTSPAAAVRVSLAMQEVGISLRGATFLLGGEPLTRARRRSIEASGATAAAMYGFSEGGFAAGQCANPQEPDDVHLALDAFAVIQRRQASGDGGSRGALLLTALRSASPKMMLNTEIGDSAVVETRRCGCFLDEFGYLRHLHTIRSFAKLTGDGVTFVGADVVGLIEDVLPGRFGGSPVDYQLVEEETARGLPRYRLIVNPTVGPLDERAVVATFLEGLSKLRRPYPFMARLWAQADAVVVSRECPVSTGWGKVLPVHTLETH